jgi:hypothetical protein
VPLNRSRFFGRVLIVDFSNPGVSKRFLALYCAPPEGHDSQDLVWCKEALEFLGVSAALRTWGSYRSASGCVAFTEPVWS